MAISITAQSPLAQTIQNAVQPRVIDNGWVADENDMTLAEYVKMMLVDGKTQDQMRIELGTDLLGVGEDDPAIGEFLSWLFAQIPIWNSQLNGEQTNNSQLDPTPQVNGQDTSDMQMDDAPVPATAPSGPKAMRDGTAGSGRGRGRMLGQLNRQMDRSTDDKLFKIKGAATGTSGRIGKSNGQRGARGNMNSSRGGMNGRGAVSGSNAISPQQQMQLMQMMEMQNQMMAQIMGGQAPTMAPFQMPQQGKSLFDRVDKPARKHNQPRQHNGDVDMAGNDEADERKAPFDTLCHFNAKCTVATCPYAHQSPAAPPGTSVDLSDACSFGAACENRKCSGKHPSPAQRRQHLSQEVDCKFYPNCTNPSCPFKHPDMPACRNGADCSTPNCKFSHSKIMCRYNPCLNPGCVYKHADGQKRGKFDDKVWTKSNGDGVPTSDRFQSLVEHNEAAEELIVPGSDEGTAPPEAIVT